MSGPPHSHPALHINRRNGPSFKVLSLTVQLFSLLCTTPANAQNPLKDNSPGCSCYTTTGSTAAYFTYHRFHDFRALARTQVDIPSPVADGQDGGDEGSTNEFFDGPAWTADWRAQSWAKNATADGPVKLVNSPQNVYIGQDQPHTATYLALRTTRLATFQSTAEIESLQKNVLYASMRVRARVYGDAGAVAGLFLYYDDACESDIEILTADPSSRIHYSNQPTVDAAGNLIAAASRDVTLPHDARWTAWHDHRVDWLPARSAWYLDGVSVANTTYGVPRQPSSLTLNMWSDGGVWSGNMRARGEAFLQIQWIEMLFNTSGPVTGPPGATTAHHKRWSEDLFGPLAKRGQESGCRVPCAVDGVRRTGWPEYSGGAVPAPNEDRLKGTVPLLLLGTLAVAAVGDVELAFAGLVFALLASFVVAT